MSVLQIIASDSFIAVNKQLIKELGLEAAVILGELASEHNYWTNNKGLTDDGYFFSTVENIEEKTSLTGHQQRAAIKQLEEAEIVSVKIKGLPAKRYIKINEEQVLKIFKNLELKKLRTASENFKEQELNFFNGNNNITKDNISKTTSNIYTEETSSSLDVSQENEDKFTDEVKEVIAYLNQKTNKNYRASSNLAKKHIVARFNEKYTLDDFRKVIDVKTAEWLNTEHEKYLRPETLFGNKFDSYLNSRYIVSKATAYEQAQSKVQRSTFDPRNLSGKKY